MITNLLQRMQLRNSQMEGMPRARYGGEGCGASMPAPGVLPSQHADVFTNSVALQILFLGGGGVLGKFHDTGMTDAITGSPAPLPRSGVGLKAPPITCLVFLVAI